MFSKVTIERGFVLQFETTILTWYVFLPSFLICVLYRVNLQI